MTRTRLLIAASLLGLVVGSSPAHAGDLGDTGFFSYWFHRYGDDDVNRPGVTPDRPYWHGDDAVPPAMRWHDRDIEIVDQYGITIATQLPPPPVVIAAAEVLSPMPEPPVVRHRKKRRHARVAPARSYCPPPVTASVSLPQVPAPTEH